MAGAEVVDEGGHVERLSSMAGLKRLHLARLSNQTGASGERHLVAQIGDLVARPRGPQLRLLLAELAGVGISIASSSFDAIRLPAGAEVDFSDSQSVRQYVSEMTFVEIKSTNKVSVRDDFSGFFFSLTEKEIEAAHQLGHRHVVLLHHRVTGALLETSVGEIVAKSRSTTWQVSVQL